MTSSLLPLIRLKPKTDPRRLRRGFPWVYANELVTDRRTRALEPGALARLEDGENRLLGLVAVNPASRIFCRMLARDPETVIDQTWFAGRIATALAHRERFFDTPFYRLIHAEADGLPGVVIDRFGDVAVIQPNAAWADARYGDLAGAVAAVTGVTTIVKSASGRARSLEGLDDQGAVTLGDLAGPVAVSMNGATYMADLLGGQKTGLFFDQRPNHTMFQTLSKGSSVLDVFSHVGGFGLAALAGGATSALAVDGSAPALALAEAGADAMGARAQFATQKGDAFEAMTALADEGRTFGAVVCDPPAFAPTKQTLEAGLRAYEKTAKLACPLVDEGGYLVLCSCSHAADLEKFSAACLRGIGRAGRRAQLIHTGYAGVDHPLMPELAESGYLKVLFFRLLP